MFTATSSNTPPTNGCTLEGKSVEGHSMFPEHYWVHQRYELYTLIQAHPDWGLRRLAHTTGHDIKWVAKWRARFLHDPPQTLSGFCSASRAPHHIPQRTTPQAKQIVVELRNTFSERYHRPAGGKTL